MTDWTKPMSQTYEYYVVDPGTWKDTDRLTTVKSCTVNRDASKDTLGSASMEITEDIGESYVRIYLVATQNKIKERVCLGTYLFQTSGSSYDGKLASQNVTGYTPLMELSEKYPPLGYYSAKDANIADEARILTRNNLRAPVVGTESSEKLYSDFVANTDDTWLTYLSDLLSNVKCHFELDELGRVLHAPDQLLAGMQPVWTYTDSNSSILYPDMSVDKDLYGVPNVVEVTYSSEYDVYYAKAVNDDPNSIVSTVQRGREIPKRITNPSFSGEPTQVMINEYAEQYLESVSTLTGTLSYKHGYCPVRIFDCIRFNYNRAGFRDIRAKVISQSISCEDGCPVEEKAAYSIKLWR